jgi:nitrilase
VSQCVEPKQFHDVVGYYNRFDVFDLKVTRKRLAPIEFLDEAPLSFPKIISERIGDVACPCRKLNPDILVMQAA